MFHFPHPPSISTDLAIPLDLRVDIESPLSHSEPQLSLKQSARWLLVQGVDTQLGARLEQFTWCGSERQNSCARTGARSSPVVSIRAPLAAAAPCPALGRNSGPGLVSAWYPCHHCSLKQFFFQIQINKEKSLPTARVQAKCIIPKNSKFGSHKKKSSKIFALKENEELLFNLFLHCVKN